MKEKKNWIVIQFFHNALVLDNLEFLEHVGSLLGEQEFVGFIHDIVVA